MQLLTIRTVVTLAGPWTSALPVTTHIIPALETKISWHCPSVQTVIDCLNFQGRPLSLTGRSQWELSGWRVKGQPCLYLTVWTMLPRQEQRNQNKDKLGKTLEWQKYSLLKFNYVRYLIKLSFWSSCISNSTHIVRSRKIQNVSKFCLWLKLLLSVLLEMI